MDARIDGRQTKKERIKDVRYQESSVTLDCAQEAAVKGHLFFCLYHNMKLIMPLFEVFSFAFSKLVKLYSKRLSHQLNFKLLTRPLFILKSLQLPLFVIYLLYITLLK